MADRAELGYDDYEGDFMFESKKSDAPQAGRMMRSAAHKLAEEYAKTHPYVTISVLEQYVETHTRLVFQTTIAGGINNEANV